MCPTGFAWLEDREGKRDFKLRSFFSFIMVRQALRARPATAQCSARAFRAVGEVRKTFPNPGWLVRFRFLVDGKICTFHGPPRADKIEAEADRRVVAVSMAQARFSSRVDIASRVLQSLKDGSALSCSDDPGTASSFPALDAKILRQMKKSELRDLASFTVGVQRNKKNSKGKWVPKTSKEIVTSLLAVRANMEAQALPGPNAQARHHARSRSRAGAMIKRPASSGSIGHQQHSAGSRSCAVAIKKRPASSGSICHR